MAARGADARLTIVGGAVPDDIIRRRSPPSGSRSSTASPKSK
jgi:hypothetical protein